MSQQQQQDIVYDTGTGGFVTVRIGAAYTVYSFTQQADADLFLAKNANAEKRNTKVKYSSAWTDDKYVTTKATTHVVLIRH